MERVAVAVVEGLFGIQPWLIIATFAGLLVATIRHKQAILVWLTAAYLLPLMNVLDRLILRHHINLPEGLAVIFLRASEALPSLSLIFRLVFSLLILTGLVVQLVTERSDSK